MTALPDLPLSRISELSRGHLEAVVAIDSSSDERSTTVPSTEGQRHLSRYLETFFAALGADVHVDEHTNVIARLSGRGACAERPPLALMIHLDTARGTKALPKLSLLPTWNGDRIPYPDNQSLEVCVANYPTTADFVGHDLVHGPGRAPFGLDDKLGLAHIMTLARLLAEHPEIPHRPLLLIGRPDEEIGREQALIGLAEWLATEGVDSGYTIDGLAAFEVNLENFNGMAAAITFAARALADGPGEVLDISLLGVNTHGATAKAEGHRCAVRLAAEIVEAVADRAIHVLQFESDATRDCDGILRVRVAGELERTALDHALEAVVGPHVARGAGWSCIASEDRSGDGAAAEMLRFVNAFMRSRSDVPLLAEDSEGFQGYTHPYRALPREGGLQLDLRVRDFDAGALRGRVDHLRSVAAGRRVEVTHQYDNMGPKLQHRRDLLDQAMAAAEAIGVTARELPIRGGTGVDAFLDRGVFIANLGTGYFAPESEKEFTSMQLLARLALWLIALVQQ